MRAWPVQVAAAVVQPADFVAIRAGRVVAMRWLSTLYSCCSIHFFG